MELIDFQNVSKIYSNGTKALKDVSLRVDDGEFVFIVGSSGAGKSTFLKLITCEERPSEGEITVGEQKLSELKRGDVPYLRRRMGMVFQDFRLIQKMTVYENVAFAMHVVGASSRDIRRRVPYILGLVNLQDKADCHPRELSGGEQQRVGLARALINSPRLLIADEPTGNIDPALSFEIVDLFSEINKRGTTILMVTHEHSLVKRFGRRVIEIHGGSVVADSCNWEARHDQ
nr:cell division ATP-binding protein FtsE [Caproicibacter sp. BJN0012]